MNRGQLLTALLVVSILVLFAVVGPAIGCDTAPGTCPCPGC